MIALALGAGEVVLPARHLQAGRQPFHVPFPRAGEGLVEVVHVEEQVALGRAEDAEVGEVGVAARLDVAGPTSGSPARSAVMSRAAPRKKVKGRRASARGGWARDRGQRVACSSRREMGSGRSPGASNVAWSLRGTFARASFPSCARWVGDNRTCLPVAERWLGAAGRDWSSGSVSTVFVEFVLAISTSPGCIPAPMDPAAVGPGGPRHRDGRSVSCRRLSWYAGTAARAAGGFTGRSRRVRRGIGLAACHQLGADLHRLDGAGRAGLQRHAHCEDHDSRDEERCGIPT